MTTEREWRAAAVTELDYLCRTPSGTLAAYGVAAVKGFFAPADIIKVQPRKEATR